MVWTAWVLLAFTTAMTGVAPPADLWHWPRVREQTGEQQAMIDALRPGDPVQALADAYYGAARAAVAADESAVQVFARWVVAAVFLGFLLPLWSLSFATEAIGGDRENN